MQPDQRDALQDLESAVRHLSSVYRMESLPALKTTIGSQRRCAPYGVEFWGAVGTSLPGFLRFLTLLSRPVWAGTAKGTVRFHSKRTLLFSGNEETFPVHMMMSRCRPRGRCCHVTVCNSEIYKENHREPYSSPRAQPRHGHEAAHLYPGVPQTRTRGALWTLSGVASAGSLAHPPLWSGLFF